MFQKKRELGRIGDGDGDAHGTAGDCGQGSRHCPSLLGLLDILSVMLRDAPHQSFAVISELIRVRLPSLCGSLALSICLCAVSPWPGGRAHAQVTGAVRDDSGRPVPAAFVALYDSAGRRTVAALSDTTGAFRIAPPYAGRFSVRTERIGFKTARSELMSVKPGEPVRLDVSLIQEAFAIAEIQVEKTRGCEVRPKEGGQTARLWDDARKALTVASWADAQRLFHYDLLRWRRDLHPATLRVLKDSAGTSIRRTSAPFTARPAAHLVERGFFEKTDSGSYLLAPDANVLLSDPFLDTHCFRVHLDATQGDMIGLAFEPVRGRRLPEVKGTLWLHRSSGALSHLEYEYVNLPNRTAQSRSTGRLEFEPLPTGAWIVRRWFLRSPVVGERKLNWGNTTRTEQQIVAVQEDGGEVVRIFGRDGKQVRTSAFAELTGSVRDADGAPLTGAAAYLIGTNYSATTDSAGNFAISEIPQGSYRVSVSHPRVDSLPPESAPVVDAQLTGAASVSVQLSLPTLTNALARICAAAAANASAGPVGERPTTAVTGLVRHAQTGAPVPNARVILSFSDWDLSGQGRVFIREAVSHAEVTADESGRFTVCQLPVASMVKAQVLDEETVTGEVTFRALAGGTRIPDLVATPMIRLKRKQ
jgi:hypothetical protein